MCYQWEGVLLSFLTVEHIFQVSEAFLSVLCLSFVSSELLSIRQSPPWILPFVTLLNRIGNFLQFPQHFKSSSHCSQSRWFTCLFASSMGSDQCLLNVGKRVKPRKR